MSNVIQFLESMGRRPPMSAGEYAVAGGGLGFVASEQRALIARDARALAEAMSGRVEMHCAIATPEDDESEDAATEAVAAS